MFKNFETKIINFLYELSQRKAFDKLLARNTYQNPHMVIKARNRHYGFDLDPSADFNFDSTYTGASDATEALLERIIEAYLASKKHQPQSGPYAVSGLWIYNLERSYGIYNKSIQSSDKAKLNQVLSNFFRQHSEGLSASGSLPDNFGQEARDNFANNYIASLLDLATYTGIDYIARDMEQSLYYVYYKKNIKPSQLYADICSKASLKPVYPSAGNPLGLKVQDSSSMNIIPQASLRHLYMALRVKEIREAYPLDSKLPIVEIGGGFGGFQYYLSQLNGNSPLTIRSYDIPEINLISSYFLSKALPEVEVVFYGETASTSNKNKIYIMPNYTLKDLAQASVGLTVNSNSITEMSPETMREYLGRIAETSGFFFSTNQDCGVNNQNRLSQINPRDFGLKCLSHNVSWMNNAYFERLYKSLRTP